jgi:hypothetical protein
MEVVSARKSIECTARTRGPRCAAALALSLLGASSAADAQPRASLHLEAAAGVLPSGPPPGAVAFGPTLEVSARVGVDLRGSLSLQLSGAHRHFFAVERDASLNLLTVGLRFSPRLASVGHAFVDLNLGPAVTVRQAAAFLAVDVGVGFEFALTRSLRLGPVVRYSRLFANPPGFPDDAQTVTFGASFSYATPDRVATAGPIAAPDPIIPDRPMCPLVVRGDRDPLVAAFDAGPPDRDRDRVPDEQDHCPDVPAGAHPDAACAGCPAWPLSP